MTRQSLRIRCVRKGFSFPRAKCWGRAISSIRFPLGIMSKGNGQGTGPFRKRGWVRAEFVQFYEAQVRASAPMLSMDCTITHERGPMSRQVHHAALAWGGEPAWQSVLQRVSSRCRERFQQPVGFFEWVESPLALELHDAWAAVRGIETMGQRGESAAQEMLALGGVQAWILRTASTHFLLTNVPRLFDFYYRGGRVELVSLEPNRCVYDLHAMGYPETWFREGLPAWIRVALEQSGAREIHIRCQQPTDTSPHLHTYEVTWAK